MRRLLVFLLRLLQFFIMHPVMTLFLQVNIALYVYHRNVSASFRLVLVFLIADLIVLIYGASHLVYWQEDVSRQLHQINRKLDRREKGEFEK